MKTKLYAISILFAAFGQLKAANFVISNVNDGLTDTIYADSSNSLLSTGIVTLGVFTDGFDVNSNLTNQSALVSNFTNIFASGAIGGPSASLGGSYAGYTEYAQVNGSPLLTGDPLIGRTLYSFIGNGASLATSTQFALLNMGLLPNEDFAETDFSSNPDFAVTTLIGAYDTITGNHGGQGSGTFTTLQLQTIPEPSTFLLASLGVLALLRRRR